MSKDCRSPLRKKRDPFSVNRSLLSRAGLRFIGTLFAAFQLGACIASAASAGAASAITVPAIKVTAGFAVERIYAVPRETAGSWVSLAADDRGRLYAGDQYGPLHRIELPREADGALRVTALGLPIGGAHGLSWINGSLYVAASQKSVSPTGLYRIRDGDADGELDKLELLRELDGDGEHGPHAVAAAPDGKSLYVMAGNATKLPPLARSHVPRFWGEDSLLTPLPALMGSETRGILPGGWICRTDLDGRSWELVCAGFRNAYALAFDVRGELFTFDSDTEFEINLPWYRPTRVLHAVSGADFGWRRGALKIPDGAPDIWPSVLPMGLGSPTAVMTPLHARIPRAHREALWIADWSYGKIFAIDLQPNGATFTARREEIVSGMPLPVTAMCVNPADGAIYFTTGGRRQQSALYRLRWTGALRDTENAKLLPAAVASAEVAARKTLEAFHGREDPKAVDVAGPLLGSDDPIVRRAARVAIESQPVSAWRERALRERSPRVALTALLALARADAPQSQAEILAALRKMHDAGLDPALRGEWLRVLALALGRGGGIPKATPDGPPASHAAARATHLRDSWAPLLSALFPSDQRALNPALFELLVYCESPDAAAKGVAALRTAVTREAQLDLAKSLRDLRTGWTPALRREFFDWLAQTLSWRGGGTFGRFLQKIRDDALASAPESERAELRQVLAAAAKKVTTPDYALTGPRPVVRAWTTEDLTMLAQNDTRKRDAARGRKIFGAAGCFGCHTFDGEGGILGPDLSAATRRLSVHELFEAIVEPSREISDQYGTVLIRTRDGRQLSGRIVNLTDNGLQLAENLADPSNVVRLAEPDIASIEPSKISLMPPGLLNAFSEEEILDLLAFLRSTTTGLETAGRR
jgi:putative heme-binding domain-containing protein